MDQCIKGKIVSATASSSCQQLDQSRNLVWIVNAVNTEDSPQIGALPLLASSTGLFIYITCVSLLDNFSHYFYQCL